MEGFTVLTLDANEVAVDHVRIEIPFSVVCPIPDQTYGGTVTVEYHPGLEKDSLGNRQVRLLEWDSFAEWVRGMRKQTLTAECLTKLVTDALHTRLRPRWLSVSARATSAFHLPVTVTCTRGDKEETYDRPRNPSWY